MAIRLRPIDINAFKDRSGTDKAQVPADSITAAFYRKGATASASATIHSTDSAVSVSVYDAGRLAAGDTVQKGSDSSATATVNTVTSRTAITLDGSVGTLTLARGDRLVPTNSRPTLYDESSGGHSTGSSSATTTSSGNAYVYTKESSVDVILSGTGVTTTVKSDVPGGYEQGGLHINVADYGDDLAAAVAAAPSGAIIALGNATYVLSDTLTISKPLTIHGAGPGHSVVQMPAASTNKHGIEITNTDHVSLEGFTLIPQGTITSGNGSGVYIHGAYVCKLLNLLIVSTPKYGILCGGGMASGFVSNTTIEGCTIGSAQSGAQVYFGDAAYTCVIRHCRVVTQYGVQPTSPVTVDQIQINNAHMITVDQCDISLPLQTTTDISGFGIHIESDDATPANLPGFNIIVRNCDIETTSTAPDNHAVFAKKLRGFLFEGNYILNVGRGIYLHTCYNATLINNIYTEVSGNKIDMLNCEKCSIINDRAMNNDLTEDDLKVVQTTCKGTTKLVNGVIHVPQYATADLPAYNANVVSVGALAYDTTTNELKVIDNSHAWVVVGTQT